jgi:hypothetical protein
MGEVKSSAEGGEAYSGLAIYCPLWSAFRSFLRRPTYPRFPLKAFKGTIW